MGRTTPGGGALDRQDLLDPPAADLREAEQPQRLAGGGAVDDDEVVVAALAVAVDPEQVGQLFHAGQDADFVGDDLVDLAPGEQRAAATPGRGPSGSAGCGRCRSPGPRGWARPRRGSGAERDVEAVGQAVGEVGAHDDGAVAELGGTDGGGGGDGGLSDAALAGVEDDAHGGWGSRGWQCAVFGYRPGSERRDRDLCGSVLVLRGISAVNGGISVVKRGPAFLGDSEGLGRTLGSFPQNRRPVAWFRTAGVSVGGVAGL